MQSEKKKRGERFPKIDSFDIHPTDPIQSADRSFLGATLKQKLLLCLAASTIGWWWFMLDIKLFDIMRHIISASNMSHNVLYIRSITTCPKPYKPKLKVTNMNKLVPERCSIRTRDRSGSAGRCATNKVSRFHNKK